MSSFKILPLTNITRTIDQLLSLVSLWRKSENSEYSENIIKRKIANQLINQLTINVDTKKIFYLYYRQYILRTESKLNY